MNRMSKFAALTAVALTVLVAAFVLLSQYGGVRILPSLASDDNAEFDQAMGKVRVVAEDPEATVDWVSVHQAILRL